MSGVAFCVHDGGLYGNAEAARIQGGSWFGWVWEPAKAGIHGAEGDPRAICEAGYMPFSRNLSIPVEMPELDFGPRLLRAAR